MYNVYITKNEIDLVIYLYLLQPILQFFEIQYSKFNLENVAHSSYILYIDNNVYMVVYIILYVIYIGNAYLI